MVDAVGANVGAPHGGEPLSEMQEASRPRRSTVGTLDPCQTVTGVEGHFRTPYPQPVVGE